MSSQLLVATRKGLFQFDPSDWTVRRASFLGDNLSMITRDPRDGALYAALDHGHFGVKLQRSEDDGATWTEIAAPEYPPLPDGYELKPNPISGKPIDWKLKLIWALEPGGDDQPGRLWCGTLPGGLFRSDDRGASWSIVESLWMRPEREEWFGGGYDQPGIHTVLVDPRNADHITVGISCGGAWRSEDSGATWSSTAKGMRANYMPPERAFDENIQDPHLIARCQAHPDHLGVQHHNGVFRSTDNGAHWSEIEEPAVSGFGFAVAAHPTDPNTAWFVPAIKDEKRIPVDGQVVVTRTTDGGSSWDVLRNGLPQDHAYDLTFRHSLAVSPDGAQLAFGTTTGALFVSSDGGDSWTQVHGHLPPVYAVKFA